MDTDGLHKNTNGHFTLLIIISSAIEWSFAIIAKKSGEWLKQNKMQQKPSSPTQIL